MHYWESHSEKVGSPGMGVTPTHLSRDPLASEGEATPGPDDYNPFEDPDRDFDGFDGLDVGLDASPTEGDDPFVFDDVAPDLAGHSFF